MTHRPVYDYEVELKLMNPNTGETRTVIRQEPAYNPFDAWHQALLVVAGEAGSAEIKTVAIRPCAAAIAASQGSLDKEIADSVMRLIRKSADGGKVR